MVDLRFTGERVVPGDMQGHLSTLTEHLERYVFALSLLRGQEKVVDAACGSGYGTFLLWMATGNAVGIDVSEEAVSYAQERFAMPGLSYEVGDLDELRLPAQTQAVVSFETIEHLKDPAAFVSRVEESLEPGGIFVCSIPRNLPSEWHLHVFEWDDARALVEGVFGSVKWFGQTALVPFPGWRLAGFQISQQDVAAADYFLAVCHKSGVSTG